jgi:hypothetical protein
LNVKLVGASRNQQDLKGKMLLNFLGARFTVHGPDISVDIATEYGLDGPGIEFRWG